MKEEYNQREYYDDGGMDIDIIDLIFAIIRRWKLIVLIAIPIIAFGGFKAIIRPTMYKAEVTLMITNPNAATSIGAADLYVDDKLISTYIQLVKSTDIMARVINKYDLNDSPEGLAARVNLTPVRGTAFMKLSYTSGERELTAPIANEVANEFIYKIAQVVKLRNITVLENAVGAYQLPKNQKIIVLVAIVLGLVLGGGVAGLIELIHRKLRKADEIEKILGAKMLGMIPEVEMKGREENES